MPGQDSIPLQPADGSPRFSQRLFSEEVGIAMADSEQTIEQRDPGYEWSNGRRFVSGDGSYQR